jgi:hypothetical protein
MSISVKEASSERIGDPRLFDMIFRSSNVGMFWASMFVNLGFILPWLTL